MNRTVYSIVVAVVLAAALGIAWYLSLPPAEPPGNGTDAPPTGEPGPGESSGARNFSAALGKEFDLRLGQTAEIKGTGLTITVKQFFNSPCPPGARCVWSGVGALLEYRKDGETKQGIDLAEAFGYRTEIVRTDHESYVRLVVRKAQ